jgi:hypothetical protein
MKHLFDRNLNTLPIQCVRHVPDLDDLHPATRE